MNLEQLKEILIQENITLREVLQEFKLQEFKLQEDQGVGWIPPPLPYPGYTTPARFGFMSKLMSKSKSKLEALAQPLSPVYI